jgi:putative transcriptional regulator
VRKKGAQWKRNIKTRVAEIRKAVGLTQSKLAKEAETSVTQVQNIEYGDSAPNVYLARHIAKALNTTVEEIFPIAQT